MKLWRFEIKPLISVESCGGAVAGRVFEPPFVNCNGLKIKLVAFDIDFP